MVWTPITPTGGNTYTDSSVPTTTYTQLEPTGFGIEPFGSPSDIEPGIKIHMRGFGSPTTNWTGA